MKLNTVISWILLAYFALFVVPPVSTFASPHYTAAPEAGCSLMQDRHQAPPLFFDIILWQQLKKTKHSEEFLASFPGNFDNGAAGMQSCDETALVPLKSDSPGLVNFLDHAPRIHQSRSSDIHFSRSGISPPAFSS